MNLDPDDGCRHCGTIDRIHDGQCPSVHRVTFDGGLPGIKSGKVTQAVAHCACGARAFGKTRKAARDGLEHRNV